METGVIVTIAIFCASVIWGASRLTARVDHLEQWRTEAREEFRSLHGHLDRIEDLIKNGTV